MSLDRSSLIAGGASLRTYVKDGVNVHTEYIEEWIVIEDQNLALNTNHFWRLRDKNSNVRLVTLWAATTGAITLKIQNQGTDIFSFTITNTQAAAGFTFPSLVLPAKYDLVINPAAAVTRFLLVAKEVAIPEIFSLTRQ